MDSSNNKAPLARMSRIVPSLETLTSKTDLERRIPLESLPVTHPENEDGNPNIPDGGWGWVVVFATFMLCAIADGVTFSFGMLYPHFVKEFEASNSATSWIGSLFMAVPLLTGPIMSALVDKFGCRSMTILGGLISASGFILSSKCYTLEFMYLTFGILAGLGLGLIYVTVVVCVAFWFDKRRTFAVGIGSSGIGFGTFIFSPLTNYLIAELGWRGTTLILGGFFLNMCVCGCLMLDPDWIIEQNSQNSKSKGNSKDSLASVDVEALKAFLTSDKGVETLVQDLETSLGDTEETTKLKNYFQSTLNLPTFVRQHEKVPVEVLELLSSNKKISNVILSHYPSLILTKKPNNVSTGKELARAPSVHQDTWPKHHHDAENPLLPRKNSTHEKYFKNLKLDKHSLIHRGALFNTNKYRFKASSCPNIYRVSMVSIPKEKEEKWYTEYVDLIKDMFDYSLFSELHFFLLSLSTITLFTWFIVPYFYLADMMVKKGGYTDAQASFTIGNIGLSNTAGMLLLGWAGDQPWMNITKAYAVFLVLCGVAIAGQMWFLENMILLQISASLFGIGLSSHFAFTPGIVMELVPMDRFTIAYGLQLLCQGIGTLVGPPYAGLLIDITGTFEQSFYQAAIWIVLSGIFVWMIPYVGNKKMFGKGPVEKIDETSKNRWIQFLLLLGFMALSFVMVFYLTGTAIHSYYERNTPVPK